MKSIDSTERLKLKKLGWFGKKILIFLLIFSLFAQTLFNLALPVFAASSPWAQTDWSGGSGQTSWSNTTQYSTGSNVTTSTANHVTIANSEKFSNTGFETNLTGWSTGVQPDSISGLKLWLKADAITGLNNNDPVSNWTDSSGTGNTISGSGATRPLYKTNTMNGLPVVQFDGINDFMSSPNSDLSNTLLSANKTVFVAHQRLSSSNFTRIINAALTAGSTRFSITQDTTNYVVTYTTGSSQGNLTTSTAVTLNPTIETVLQNNTDLNAFINGTNGGGGVTNAGGETTTTTTIFGASTGGGGAFANVNMSEVIVYDSGLSSANRSKIENYLSSKYNISVSSGITSATRDTSITYGGSAASAKLITSSSDGGEFTQSVNVGNTNSYNLVTYAYKDGSAVSSSDIELFYNGSTVSTTYTSVGSGWYKLTGTVTGANASRQYGVQVKANKTIYVDNFSLNNYATSGSLTSSIFDSGSSVSWGTLTYSATTPTNTSVAVKVRTSNNSDMSGATDFSSCTAISSGSDISNNSCVSDSNQYVQYQLNLATTDQTITPDFTSFSLSFAAITPSPTPNSNSNSSSNNSSPSAPSCNNSTPGLTPISLYGALPQDGNTIMLNWTDASSPYDHYVLEYGLQPGNYIYGSNDIGGVGNRSYRVGSLTPNTTYYFRIRAGNGCAPGAWSNEISATTKSLFSSNQLVFTSSQLTPSIEPEPTTTNQNTNNSCEEHTVESGDSLWAIAKQSLGNGSRYQEIIDSNTDEYPSLKESNNLSTGWVLKISCDGEQPGKQAKTENSSTNTDLITPQGGYELNVKVTDDNKKPVEGATVTIHSKVQTTTTSKDGIAEFKNVESGQHQVLIAYDNFEGEQSINLTGDVKKFDLTVTVQPKNVLLSPLVLAVIGILLLIIIVLGFALIKIRKTRQIST